jgi:hypothetical protein
MRDYEYWDGKDVDWSIILRLMDSGSHSTLKIPATKSLIHFSPSRLWRILAAGIGTAGSSAHLSVGCA